MSGAEVFNPRPQLPGCHTIGNRVLLFVTAVPGIHTVISSMPKNAATCQAVVIDSVQSAQSIPTYVLSYIDNGLGGLVEICVYSISFLYI